MSDLAPTLVLRRMLEEALATSVASSVLFEALGVTGVAVPQTRDEVLTVVRGPLRQVLGARIGELDARTLITRIEDALTPGDLTTQEVPLDELVRETRREDATATFPIADRAVRVLIVAGGRGFEHRLALALGDRRAAPSTVTGHDGLRHALAEEPPALFIVDASDFPAIEPGRVLAAAGAFPATTTCVLWGPELPYGKKLAEGGSTGAWVTLELREGIEPLFDLVRSRRKSRSA